MKKILFLHGFFASGSCIPAIALHEAFEGRVRVITPDLPIHPKEALTFVQQLCDKEKPDLLVGNSNGSFLAQIIAPIVGIPALLGNPHLEMTEFLKPRIGEHQYKSPRMDGKQDFIIDEALISEFEELQKEQFKNTSPYWKDKIWGIGLREKAARQISPEEWPGHNLLGKVLMQVRNELSSEGM